MTATGEPAGYKLAYEAAMKTVEEEATTLRETRDRTGALLSVALLTGGLVAGLATVGAGSPDLGGIGYFGGSLIGAAILGIAILTIFVWQPAEASLSLNAAAIIGSYVEGPQALQEAELHRELALHLNENSKKNQEVLGATRALFRLGLGVMLVEVVGVAMLLWDIANG